MKQGNVAKSPVVAGLVAGMVAGAIGLAATNALAFDYGLSVLPSQCRVDDLSYAGNMVCGTFENAGTFAATSSAVTPTIFSQVYGPTSYSGHYRSLNDDGSIKGGRISQDSWTYGLIDRGPGNFETFGERYHNGGTEAFKMSGDGSVMLVRTWSANTEYHHVRSANGAINSLQRPDFAQVRAHDISRNGQTVVGWALEMFQGDAFKWTAANGFEILPLPSGVIGSPSANCVSADGSVVAGSVGSVPCIWAGGGVTTAPFPGDSNGGTFVEMNDNGTVMVGSINLRVDGPYVPFGAVWTTSDGWILAADYFAAYGIAMPEGRRVASLEFVSSDATTFCGIFDNGQYFVAAIPAPASLATLVSLGVLGARRRR